MQLNNMKDLLNEQLRDLFYAETQLIEALPKMAGAASNQKLKDAFTEHLKETEGHVDRLRKACQKLGIDPSGQTCEAMEGLIEEGEEAINAQGDPTVRDAALIASAQRVEHYEIAGYGSVRTFAKNLNEDEIADLMEQTLKEEKSADDKLNKLAEGGFMSSGVNQEAKKS